MYSYIDLDMYLPICVSHTGSVGLSRDRVLSCFAELRADVQQAQTALQAAGLSTGISQSAQVSIDRSVRKNLVQAGGYGNLFALVPSKLRLVDTEWSGE